MFKCHCQLGSQCHDVYTFELYQSHVGGISRFVMVSVMVCASGLVSISECCWNCQFMSSFAIWLGVVHKACLYIIIFSIYNE
jgi:hypothetical protein